MLFVLLILELLTSMIRFFLIVFWKFYESQFFLILDNTFSCDTFSLPQLKTTKKKKVSVPDRDNGSLPVQRVTTYLTCHYDIVGGTPLSHHAPRNLIIIINFIKEIFINIEL